MEPEGAVRIFARSELERGLRYMEYLEDGDSSSFLKVKKSKPYGDHVIKKINVLGIFKRDWEPDYDNYAMFTKVKSFRMENPLTTRTG